MDVDVDRETMSDVRNSDISSGATCRICRGDATDDNPLFHPCKCKGSIKYIHESCLIEWISSKNVDISKPGTTATCDICHYPINFSTTYAENMPDRIPVSLLMKRSLISCFHFVKDGLTLNLAAVLFLLGIPLTWNFFGKLYTMILDGELPYKGDFHKSVAYGYRDDISEGTSLLLQYTLNFRFSILQIVMVVILHISLYFQYDMIVRESVMSKMIFHKIGPQYTKEELIKIQLKERFPMMDNQTIEHVARLMKARDEAGVASDIHDDPTADLGAEPNEESDEDDEPSTTGDSTGEGNSAHETTDLDSSGDELEEEERQDELVDDTLSEDEVDVPIQRPFDAFMHRRAQNEFDELVDRQNEEANDHAVPIIDGGRNEEGDADGPMVEGAGEDDMIQQAPPPIVINLKLKLVNVLAYYIVAEVLVAVYLAVAYLLPTVVGFGLIKVAILFGTIAQRGAVHLYYVLQLFKVYHLALENVPYFEPLCRWMSKNVVSVWVYYYDGYVNNTLKSSIVTRSLPAVVTYIATISIISVSSELLCKGYGRENGVRNRTKRFIFQILFAIKCTVKVFTLFFIELAGFPILAGLMLDFSIFAPLLSPGNILWAPHILTVWPPLIFFIYWTIGTLYMYWFAKYIGMIRQHIIRPGVLFFIRSPDDPNIKILHDSLIHPMSIQVSRLCLSMFIYAVFIIVGFGFHTRFLFPVLLKSKLLTTNNCIEPSSPQVVYLLLFYITKQIVESKPSVKLYIRKYWERAFDVSAKKLRLSSFILGHDIPTERGHILYRNFFYRFFAKKRAEWSNPQLFTMPKTLDQTKTLFREDPNIHAYFVPDGILMRVPSSDIVSRNYVQTLFVPVTKDDKLLRPLDLGVIKARNQRNAGDFGYLDEQNTEFDAYSIVYTPPNFRMRYMSLLVFVWLFASLMVLLTALLCQYSVATLLALILLPATSLLSKSDSTYRTSKQFIQTKFQQLDIFFVCAGAIILSILLERYHAYKISRIVLSDHIVPVVNEDTNEPEPNANNNIRLEARPAQDIRIVIRNLLNHEEVKFLVFLIGMLAILYVRYVALLVNLRSLRYFGLGYISPKYFKDFEILLSPTNLFKADFEELAFLLLQNLSAFYIGRKFANNRHRPFSTWFKLIHGDLISQVSFILYTTIPLVLSWTTFASLEYFLHPDRYTSFSAVIKFLWHYRLSPQSNDIPWTIPQHLFFSSLYVIMSSYIVWKCAFAAKKWFGVAIQNVKDEVYAKGRSLQNFSGGD